MTQQVADLDDNRHGQISCNLRFVTEFASTAEEKLQGSCGHCWKFLQSLMIQMSVDKCDLMQMFDRGFSKNKLICSGVVDNLFIFRCCFDGKNMRLMAFQRAFKTRSNTRLCPQRSLGHRHHLSPRGRVWAPHPEGCH